MTFTACGRCLAAIARVGGQCRACSALDAGAARLAAGFAAHAADGGADAPRCTLDDSRPWDDAQTDALLADIRESRPRAETGIEATGPADSIEAAVLTLAEAQDRARRTEALYHRAICGATDLGAVATLLYELGDKDAADEVTLIREAFVRLMARRR